MLCAAFAAHRLDPSAREYRRTENRSRNLTAILNSIGVAISKRQVVPLLTTDLEQFVEEDSAVIYAGLVSARFITVDDTGARHNRRNAFTTQIPHVVSVRDTSAACSTEPLLHG